MVLQMQIGFFLFVLFQAIRIDDVKMFMSMQSHANFERFDNS